MALNALDGLDIDLLLAFEALLDEPNVTRAARRLAIRQPALSARLTRLRVLFDDRLFIPAPSGRGMIATPRALDLQPRLAAVLANLDAMMASTGAFEPATSTRVFTVALHENPAVMLVPDLVPRIRAAAPGVRLILTLPDKVHMPELMESGAVDLWIGVGSNAHDAWFSRKLFEDHFVTAQRKLHPRGRGELDRDTFCRLDHLLVSSEGNPFNGVIDDALLGLQRRRHVALSVQSYALAPMILATTDLLCTLPRRFLERYSETLDLFTPPLELQPAAVVALWHPRHQGDAGHGWLRAQLFEAAAATRRD
ncbi:DNA-binding transcriptional LysR family regulator [Ancylobacter aquaticus]|uniref:DNA-binding transcriptional LysR family regulator n=1 Tax=Ancylobacter aquaticus TaxID=100 RepID=A0A4R1IHK7_ANCAQ|nr:LysR family transcriptional regulator [Ancylobacter aquaticus]TCK31052.1 DNA-binding transcriptional LysR family regulator [Ancylobacter aquaticus]